MSHRRLQPQFAREGVPCNRLMADRSTSSQSRSSRPRSCEVTQTLVLLLAAAIFTAGCTTHDVRHAEQLPPTMNSVAASGPTESIKTADSVESWDSQLYASKLNSSPLPPEVIGGARQVGYEDVAEIMEPAEPIWTAEAIRRQVVEHTQAVSLLQWERCLALDLSEHNPHMHETTANVQQHLLSLQSVYRVNEAAAQALELFYSLGEARRLERRLEESLTVLTEMQENLKTLRERQFEVELDPDELEFQRLEIRANQVSLKSGMRQAEAQLSALIGQPVSAEEMDWGEDGATVATAVMLPDVPISIAWQTRIELRVIRLILCHLDVETLPFARGVLQQFDVTLGTATRDWGMLAVLPIGVNDSELHTRRHQLSNLLHIHEKRIAAEIKTLIERMNESALLFAHANDAIDARNRQLQRLSKRFEIHESVTKFDVYQAQLHLIETQTKATKLYFQWKRSQVDLWKAAGTVASGYGVASRQPQWRPDELDLHPNGVPPAPPSP